ncbi:GDP-mannose transporter into the lumen of the Golgi [Marasmius oreades]|uniref:GDP-mannose transporter n=1 Tax=Marasmius oreades TaxID=181124 RepID=A0A9P7UTV0_9AGAR|nr:GDP-mannose transporter into the lumen of the Golgi [Marasmius oreades]KAG7093873.1 GDP-mannose transporter into the lumen of the Golgi [Marasmius oreades]
MASTSRKPSEDAAELKKAMATAASDTSTRHLQLSAVPPVLCYCLASILMTLVNKFVVSGAHFSMNFLLLCIQSSVCIACVVLVKKMGIISFRSFNWQDAKTWFPISFMLALVIYTGSKSLQFLSIPVYTIFKNLTIILIAYGEVVWFGGTVTSLTFVSFVLMVLSSVIAAWSDVTNALAETTPMMGSHRTLNSLQDITDVMYKLNIGYFWMFVNCLTSAAYVLTMRKRIKVTGFSDWDSMFYSNLLSIPVLAIFSFVVEDWGIENLNRNFPEETRKFLLFVIAFSGAAAVGISYTTAWCIRVTSSTTYSMVGALNKLPVAASGMLFFGDPVTTGSVSAVAVGFFAGVLYAVAKNNQKKVESRTQADAIIPLTSRKP